MSGGVGGTTTQSSVNFSYFAEISAPRQYQCLGAGTAGSGGGGGSGCKLSL